MKNILKISAVIVVLSAFWGCGESKSTKVSSTGAPYEVFVTCTQDKWDGAAGDTLREILLDPVPMINQVEPAFDLFLIQPSAMNGIMLKHRNIISIKTGAEYESPQMLAQYDVYSAPQILIMIVGPNDASVAAYMSEHAASLRDRLETAEIDRFIHNSSRYNQHMIEKQVSEKFGFKMTIPKGYMVRNELTDFMWISFEYPQASQGVVIYSYPYTDREDFTLDSLLSKRDRFTGLIPGENPGSHMTTVHDIEPDLRHLRINGRYWANMRGFWDVTKDFMGGPFVSYSTLDVNTRRVVTIDCYVFSPKYNKRNYLRQLEALVYSIKFPGDEQAAQAVEE